MRFLKFADVVIGFDDEPVKASFDADDGKKDTRPGSTAEVFKSILDSYQPGPKVILKPSEIDAHHGAKRSLKKAMAGEGFEVLRDDRYIRFDNEHFTVLRKVTEEIGPIMIQLWEQTPHFLRLLDAAIDDKAWDEEQKKWKAEQEEAAKKTASANGALAEPVPEKVVAG